MKSGSPPSDQQPDSRTSSGRLLSVSQLRLLDECQLALAPTSLPLGSAGGGLGGSGSGGSGSGCSGSGSCSSDTDDNSFSDTASDSDSEDDPSELQEQHEEQEPTEQQGDAGEDRLMGTAAVLAEGPTSLPFSSQKRFDPSPANS